MKIKHNLFLSTTIVTIVICFVIASIGIAINEKNLKAHLSFSKNLMNQLSANFRTFSENYITSHSKNYLKLETKNLTYQLSKYIKTNAKNVSEIKNNPKINNIVKTVLKINNMKVGYFALIDGKTNVLITSPLNYYSEQIINKNKYPDLYKLNQKALSDGIAKGYYIFFDNNSKTFIHKYSVFVRIPNTSYILAGVILLENYKKAINRQIDAASRNFFNKEKNHLIKLYKKSNFTVITILIVSLIIIMIFYIITINFIITFLTKPLERLIKKIKLSRPDKPDLTIEIPKYSSSEIIELTTAFKDQEKILKKYIYNFKKEEEERHILEHELDAARIIQNSALPNLAKNFIRPEFSIFAKLISSKFVAGDFYDFFYLDKNNIALLIADVSGTGIPAALFMQRAKIVLRISCVKENKHPCKALEKANETLFNKNEACMFVTTFLIYYNIISGKITYANAGHNPALYVSNKEIKTLEKFKGLALGTYEKAVYEEKIVQLSEENILMLFSDSILKAISSSDSIASHSLNKLLLNSSSTSINDLGKNILDSANKSKSNDFSDDITLLLFRRNS